MATTVLFGQGKSCANSLLRQVEMKHVVTQYTVKSKTNAWVSAPTRLFCRFTLSEPYGMLQQHLHEFHIAGRMEWSVSQQQPYIHSQLIGANTWTACLQTQELYGLTLQYTEEWYST